MQAGPFLLILGENLALMVLASFCYGLMRKHLAANAAWINHIVSGILFGLVGVFSMLFPVPVAEGIIFDGRGIAIVLAGPFGGGYGSFVAAAIVTLYRIYLGGAGMEAGLLAIAGAALLGFLWHRYQQLRPKDYRVTDFVLMGLVFWTVTMPAVFVLPWEQALLLFEEFAAPFLLFSLAGCCLLGLFLRNEALRLHTERQLVLNHQRFRDLTEVGSDYFWEMDADLRFTYVSENYESITGIPSEEVLGCHRMDLWKRAGYVIEEGLPEENRLNQAVQNREAFRRIRIRGTDRKGEALYLDLSGKPVFDRMGMFCGYRGVGLDVTSEMIAHREANHARELAEQACARAEASDKAKSEFLARMSHELRSPLNAVIGFADMMADESHGELGDPRYATYSENISKSGKHLLELIGDILDLTKIEAGHMELEETGFSLHDLISHVHEMLLPSATEKNNDLIVTLGEKMPNRLVGDPTRLMQVLVNLMSNAIKFTQGGVVKLTVDQLMDKDNQVCLRFSVEDNGVGIDGEKLQHIFDPFSQADVSTTRNYGGTGLGLAVSQRLINNMGGEITVISEKGKGSVFSFVLEFLIDNDLRIPGQPRPVELPPLKILVVDDIALNRDLARAMLANAGHEVDVADGGEATLDYLLSEKSQGLDVILLDIHMPGMDGFETFEEIRKQTAGDMAMPAVIALTADVLRDHVREYLAAGMDGFVPKPMQMQDLEKLLDRLIRESRIRNGRRQAAEQLQPAVPGK